MVEVGVGAWMQEQSSTGALAAPPHPTRRPRVREVSSRFMSPVSSSSSFSAGDLHLLASKSPLSKPQQQQQQRSTSAHRQRRHLEMESDDNRPTETTRSLDSPFQLPPPSVPCTQRKHQQRGSVNVTKLLKENASNGRFANKDNYTPSRPDTPTVASSRLRFNHRSNSTNITAAAKLLQSSGIGMSMSTQQSTDKVSATQEACDNSSQISTSDSEADLLPTVSSRLPGERNIINRGSLKFSAFPFSQSLSSSLSTCDPSSLFHPTKGSEKPLSSLSKPLTNSLKTVGGLSLPPVPPYAKLPTDKRKAGKACSHQEDVHSLRLLHNYYLQWRYANAKAQATMQAQKSEVERTLYSLGLEISNLCAYVKSKRMELGLLRRMKTLSTIIEAQMPYLEKWSAFEGDYSISLSEAIQALLDASFRLPISGNIRADTTDIGEALNSAMKLMETIIFHIQSFMPKAEEVENLISELARVTGRERVMIGECGDLLSKTCILQVEESSLRGQLIQFHRSYPGKFGEDQQ